MHHAYRIVLLSQSDWKLRIGCIILSHLSHLMRLWHFSSSVNSFFKRACAAIQWSKMSDFWSDTSSTSILYVCEQRNSGGTAQMRRLAWAFAGRLCDKYHNLMSWLINLFSTKAARLWTYFVSNLMILKLLLWVNYKCMFLLFIFLNLTHFLLFQT